jgi:hypothetical protein
MLSPSSSTSDVTPVLQQEQTQRAKSRQSDAELTEKG